MLNTKNTENKKFKTLLSRKHVGKLPSKWPHKLYFASACSVSTAPAF